MNDADVAVLGLGTMGSFAAWELSKRGQKVIGFEQFAPGHDQAGAGGESRLFRMAYAEGSDYVPLLMRAKEQWEALNEITGLPIAVFNGGITIGEPDDPFLEAARQSLAQFDLPYTMHNGRQAADLFPQHRIADHEVVLQDDASGFLRPEAAVAHAARQAALAGAELHTHTRVESVEVGDHGVRIITSDGVYRARRLVLSGGAWNSKLLHGLTPMTEVHRIAMTWFPMREPGLFTPEHFPIFVRTFDGVHFCGWPMVDGTNLKVALADGWDLVQDPDHLDRTMPQDLFAEIKHVVAKTIPGVIPEMSRIGVYMDAYTADQHGYVGWLVPDVVYGMGGFSGHGFKLAPVLGEAAAQEIVDGESRLPIGFLSPSRFSTSSTTRDRLPAFQRRIATASAAPVVSV
ncbi:N-methyl-L-tryptophan oxidase [Brevibacterium sp. 50QC2O2]|uniref:N-methyl-L-tryptophan oxidase n=1 Tax=Brevibacterium sp. 50QC2O2 TaxID=2968459 RepID=UPI00211CCDE8|nr:N-methyl-L-tryptophan oxidase [Brevibacterium sp. 50QC2O2]